MHFSIFLSATLGIVSTLPLCVSCTGSEEHGENYVINFHAKQKSFENLKSTFHNSLSAFEKDVLDGNEYNLRRSARIAAKYGEGAEASMRRNIVRIVDGEFASDVPMLVEDWPIAGSIAWVSMNDL